MAGCFPVGYGHRTKKAYGDAPGKSLSVQVTVSEAFITS